MQMHLQFQITRFKLASQLTWAFYLLVFSESRLLCLSDQLPHRQLEALGTSVPTAQAGFL